MAEFAIHDLAVGQGRLGLSQMPGRKGTYAADLAQIADWGAALVLTLTTVDELAAKGVADLPDALESRGIPWRHFPIADYGVPKAGAEADWEMLADEITEVLSQGGNVLIHCYGGCGRSGMAALRIMVRAGEAPEAALSRLREVRPCAVETDDQMAWALA